MQGLVQLQPTPLRHHLQYGGDGKGERSTECSLNKDKVIDRKNWKDKQTNHRTVGIYPDWKYYKSNGIGIYLDRNQFGYKTGKYYDNIKSLLTPTFFLSSLAP